MANLVEIIRHASGCARLSCANCVFNKLKEVFWSDYEGCSSTSMFLKTRGEKELENLLIYLEGYEPQNGDKVKLLDPKIFPVRQNGKSKSIAGDVLESRIGQVATVTQTEDITIETWKNGGTSPYCKVAFEDGMNYCAETLWLFPVDVEQKPRLDVEKIEFDWDKFPNVMYSNNMEADEDISECTDDDIEFIDLDEVSDIEESEPEPPMPDFENGMIFCYPDGETGIYLDGQVYTTCLQGEILVRPVKDAMEKAVAVVHECPYEDVDRIVNTNTLITFWKPKKKMTLAEIENALGYPIEIVS